jgi:hypothetical protein
MLILFVSDAKMFLSDPWAGASFKIGPNKLASKYLGSAT